MQKPYNKQCNECICNINLFDLRRNSIDSRENDVANDLCARVKELFISHVNNNINKNGIVGRHCSLLLRSGDIDLVQMLRDFCFMRQLFRVRDHGKLCRSRVLTLRCSSSTLIKQKSRKTLFQSNAIRIFGVGN